MTLRQLREARYLTLREAAWAVGCSPEHLSRVERRTRGASGRLVRRLARFYRLDQVSARRLCRADGRGRPPRRKGNGS